jgi:hypothetical protein
MAAMDRPTFIVRVAQTMYAGSLHVLQKKGTPEAYWRWLCKQFDYAEAVLGRTEERGRPMPGEGLADYAKLEGPDPLDAPEEFDMD